MNAEFRPDSFPRPSSLKRIDTVRGVNRAVYTLFVTPEHEKLHSTVAEKTAGELQPLHPSIPTVEEQLRRTTAQRVDTMRRREMNGRELSQLAGVLVQFTDYTPALQRYAQTDYSHVASLYGAVVEQASSTGQALTLPEQLNISLEQTEGDLTESLWRTTCPMAR